MAGSGFRYHVEKIDLNIENSSHTQLVLLAGRDKKVLEVGPATGYVTEVLKERGCSVVGLEIDPAAAEIAAQFCERMIVGNIEELDLDQVLGDKRFDVIMFGDVLEHLVDPGRILVEIARFLAPDGKVVASVPNVAHASVRLNLLAGKFPYSETGLLDRTHLRFFTRASLGDLFGNAGYEVQEWRMVLEDIEDPLAEAKLRPEFYPADLLEAMRHELDARTYQYIVVARPADHASPPVEPSVDGDEAIPAVLKVLLDKDAQLTGLKAVIAHKDADLLARDAVMANRDSEIVARDAEIANLKSETVARDAVIANKNSQLIASEQDLAFHKKTIAEQQRTYQEVLARSQELAAQLDAILQSPNYQHLKRREALVNRFAPVNSRRRALVAAMTRGFAYLLDVGAFAFLVRLAQPWKWLPRALQKTDQRPEAERRPNRFSHLVFQARHYRRAHGSIAFARRALEVSFSSLRGLLNGKRGTRPSSDDLRICLEPEIPAQIEPGQGNAIFIHGWCCHLNSRIKKLRLVANGRSFHVRSRAEWDPGRVPPTFAPELSRAVDCREFWSIVAIDSGYTELDIRLEATLKSREVFTKSLGRIARATRDTPLGAQPDQDTGEEPLVAICMATFNPRPDLYKRQIDSIKAQSYKNWLCIIADDHSDRQSLAAIRRTIGKDKRFQLHSFSQRVGFYHNFERCLSFVPADAEYVALSDHDDRWHEDKLAGLIAKFQPTTTLVYSDMNIVDEDLDPIANTYWTTRRNNYRQLDSLFLANTITGAASMFRRELLDYLLPFPQKIGEPYHDHWIGTVALALGDVDYVDRPLYDYVQHGRQVLGHFVPEGSSFVWRARSFLRGAAQVLKARGRPNVAYWRTVYFYDVIRIQLMATILELRIAGAAQGIAKQKSIIIKRIANMDVSLRTTLWLALRALRNLLSSYVTLGAENSLLRAVMWRRLSRGQRIKRRSGRGLQLTAQPVPTSAPVILSPELQPQIANQAGFIREKIAPLALDISERTPERINLVIPTIDFAYFFGGYIAKFNLARRLAEEGFRVRVITVDFCDYNPAEWKRRFRAFAGLENILDHVEVSCLFDRSRRLKISPNDSFIATTWWTAHIAHEATVKLGKPRFLYLIQEYEPFTFAMGSLSALARQSYDFPHCAIFSTDLLSGYFRENSIGVYSAGPDMGDRLSIAFENAITPVRPPDVETMRGRRPRRLLYYARPESHASRNMFDLGLLGLAQAIEEGAFEDDWQFDGIGTVGAAASMKLARGRKLSLVPRQSQEDYAEFIRNYDLGLSLMYTPHPSLVPIEMASAGMVVVTNTFANKTGAALKEISENIIGAEPTVEGVAGGLAAAVKAVGDYQARIKGARVTWSADWDRSFDEGHLVTIRRLLEETGWEARRGHASKAVEIKLRRAVRGPEDVVGQ